MRGHLLVFIGVLLCTQLSGQSLGTKIIKLYHFIKSPVDGKFYVESISDGRTFTQNIGLAHRRLDKPVVVPLILDRNFLSEFKVASDRWRSDRDGSRHVNITVREIYLWDHITSKDESRHAKVKLEFFDLEGKSLGTFSATVTDRGNYKRFSHERRFEKALWECLNKFGKSLKRPNKIIKEDEKVLASKLERKLPKFGAAGSFLDLKKKQLRHRRLNLIKVDDPGLHRFRPRDPKERKAEYYAYLDEGILYLKATNYLNSGDYFVRVLEQGRYHFMIDKISTNSLSKDLFNEDLQEKVSNTIIGIIVDGETGVPSFVTDEFLSTLMEPYPDLRDKYMIVDILSNPFQLERVRRFIGEINRRAEFLNASK